MTARRISPGLLAVVYAAVLVGHIVGAARAATPADHAARPDYEAEIARLRPLADNAITREQAMEQLGDIAVRAANGLEVALALGDVQKLEALDRLIRVNLSDTRPHVEQRAGKDDADALVALGLFYARGLLVERSSQKACAAFVKAAERQNVAGTYQAALCVLKTDPERAGAWMQRAADAGHPAAQEAIARACFERKPEPQLECAARYVTAAAQAGRPSAQSLLGWMHSNGKGVPKDLRRASELYLEAARKLDVAAQNNLGEMYEKGLWVRKSERLAAGWYRQAALAGFAPAQFNLGRMYALGAGVDRDAAQARTWLEKAKAQGITQADELLRWLDERRADYMGR